MRKQALPPTPEDCDPLRPQLALHMPETDRHATLCKGARHQEVCDIRRLQRSKNLPDAVSAVRHDWCRRLNLSWMHEICPLLQRTGKSSEAALQKQFPQSQAHYDMQWS